VSKIITIDGVGEAMFVRSRRARKLSLTLEEGSRLRVAVPYWVSYKEARSVLEKNLSWVYRFIGKMKKAKEEHSRLLLRDREMSSGAAKRNLKSKLSRLALEYGYEYEKVQIRSQRTRWGSCSHKNNISLNIKLIKLPEELVNYVILHELVHTRVKNHKNAFWSELEKVLPNAKILDKTLRKYQLALL